MSTPLQQPANGQQPAQQTAPGQQAGTTQPAQGGQQTPPAGAPANQANGTGGQQQPAQQHAPHQGQQQNGQQANGQQGNAPQQWRMEDLPEGAQSYIRDLRGEAADARTGRNAVQQQLQQFQPLLDVLAQVTGQAPANTTPAQVGAQVSADHQRLREQDVELAVLRLAGQHGADGGALVDSVDFLGRVRALDPSQQTFQATVAQEIQAAVAANPARFGAAGGQQNPAPAPGGRAMGQGRSGQQAGLSGTAAGRAMRRERRAGARGQSTTT